MKRIGFIDYYLDEFHANKYPEWIEKASGGSMKVTCAYGQIDNPNGKSNAEWSQINGIPLMQSIEEVVENSDLLIVLSPDNPEQHEQLSQLPLKSGKPTYIDKTFAPDRETAERIFKLAEQYGTPVFSTSALRYATEYANAGQERVETISSWGPGQFDNYLIHQVEPIVAFMGTEPKRVMFTGTSSSPALIIDFGDGRQAFLNHFGWDCPFMMMVKVESGPSRMLKVESDFFSQFISNLVTFFDTGQPAVPASDTIAVISIIEYGHKAMQSPYQWIDLP